MRIGMLTMDYPPRMAGGTTVHAEAMARAFARLGHTPYVVAASHPSAPAIEHGPVEVRRVRRPYTLFSAAAAGRLRAELDAVHGHGTCAYGFMRLHPGFPTVVKMHSTWREEYLRYRRMGRPTGLMPLYVHMDRYCARSARAVICISDVIRRETMAYGVPAGRIHVIHNGIDAAPFRTASDRRAELGLEDRIVVGYIGRLAPHKGVTALAKAFAEVAKGREDLALLVVGDGPERSRMEAILAPFTDRVRFTGYVPHGDVPSYYATTDIVTYPTSYEPLGNVVLEAMAAGKPLVASRTGGIPEVFCERAGILVRPPTEGAYGGLARALERLASSPSERERMGREGRQAAEAFTWERVCRETARVIEGVLRR